MKKQQRLHASTYDLGREKGRQTEYKRIRRAVVSMRIHAVYKFKTAANELQAYFYDGQHEAMKQLLEFLSRTERKPRTATKGRDAKRAAATVGAQRKK